MKKKPQKKQTPPKPKPAKRAKPSASSHAARAKRGITAIKVIGVGGGGGNAITRMMEGERMRGVEFIAANTDSQDLNFASAHRKLYLGRALTRGLGAGMNPEVGKQAAEENRSEIADALDGADVVFLTAGMGGGTGTGASPTVAEVAKEKGILTVAIVTKPFSFEGTQRMNLAQEGILRLKDRVDALVVIPNDRIFEIIDKDTSMAKAFSFVDEVLKNAVQGLAELINMPGIINVDFADIRAVMRDAGTTMIGIGVGNGQDRGIKAVGNAINSPLLETSIEGARGVLFSVSGGKDLKMTEVNEIARAITGSIDPSAKVIFGAYYDRRLKERSVKVTVIATGFSNAFGSSRFELPMFTKDTKADILEKIYREEKSQKLPVIETKESAPESEPPHALSVRDEDEDSWDVPAFLRRKDKDKKEKKGK